jgi:periplasmic protein TonB
MRLDQVAGKRRAGMWPGCIVGSGFVHLVLLGLCLLIQPPADRVSPHLRVRLVAETIASPPPRTPAATRPARVSTTGPPPMAPRRVPPEVIEVVSAPSRLPVLGADPPPPAPREAEPIRPMPAALNGRSLLPSDTPPFPVPDAPPALPLVAVPAGQPAADSAADAGGARGPVAEREPPWGEGSGTAQAALRVEPEVRGISLFTAPGTGSGGRGSGTGPGDGRGRGAGGDGVGGFGAGGNGGHGASVGAPNSGWGSGSGGSAADLREVIRRQIERAKVYPDAARRQGIQGTTDIRFRIGPDGAVSAVEVARSSGHPLLDEASADAVRRAGPYPASGWVRITLTYRVEP